MRSATVRMDDGTDGWMDGRDGWMDGMDGKLHEKRPRRPLLYVSVGRQDNVFTTSASVCKGCRSLKLSLH